MLKAMVVAKGFQQTTRIDDFDTFTPIGRWFTIILVLFVVEKKIWRMK